MKRTFAEQFFLLAIHPRKAIPLNIVIERKGNPAFYYMGFHADRIEEIETYLETTDKNRIKVDLL
tara:strand:- start:288 stop:482 length:195 start_codon:yes stop_codon:yes gene_type:complete